MVLQIACYRNTQALWTSLWRMRSCAPCRTCGIFRMDRKTNKQTTFSSALAIVRFFKADYYSMLVIQSSQQHSLMTIYHLMNLRHGIKSDDNDKSRNLRKRSRIFVTKNFKESITQATINSFFIRIRRQLLHTRLRTIEKTNQARN